jgi:hypothetical protein
LARETEVLGENLPQLHFVHHKSHMTRPDFKSEQSMWFVVDKVALGQVFSKYFGFPCQSSFH